MVPLDGEEPAVGLLVHVACDGLRDVVLRPDLLDSVVLLLAEGQWVAAPVSTKWIPVALLLAQVCVCVCVCVNVCVCVCV